MQATLCTMVGVSHYGCFSIDLPVLPNSRDILAANKPSANGSATLSAHGWQQAGTSIHALPCLGVLASGGEAGLIFAMAGRQPDDQRRNAFRHPYHFHDGEHRSLITPAGCHSY